MKSYPADSISASILRPPSLEFYAELIKNRIGRALFFFFSFFGFLELSPNFGGGVILVQVGKRDFTRITKHL